MSNYLDLAKKLKALADKGIGGEKITAKIHLDKVMQKHGITPEMLDETTETWHDFKITPDQIKLFAQTVCSIYGSGFAIRKMRNKKHVYVVKLTNVQAIETRIKFEFYWKAWQEDLTVFYEAFIQANKLLPPNAPIMESKDLTADELKRTIKMFQMAQGIEARPYMKQLAEQNEKNT